MTTVNTYDVGDAPNVSGAFTRISDSAAADPTAIIAEYKKPDGTEVTLTYGEDAALVKDSTGNYHVNITIDQSGRWYYRFAGTGDVVAAGWHYFEVRADPFTS